MNPMLGTLKIIHNFALRAIRSCATTTLLYFQWHSFNVGACRVTLAHPRSEKNIWIPIVQVLRLYLHICEPPIYSVFYSVWKPTTRPPFRAHWQRRAWIAILQVCSARITILHYTGSKFSIFVAPNSPSNKTTRAWKEMEKKSSHQRVATIYCREVDLNEILSAQSEWYRSIYRRNKIQPELADWGWSPYHRNIIQQLFVNDTQCPRASTLPGGWTTI